MNSLYGHQRSLYVGVSTVATLTITALLLAPMLFTEATFGADWVNHLWFSLQQNRSIASTGLPTYFIHNNEIGIFYPVFAFYGGTLYALIGYLSELSPGFSLISIYVLLYALGFLMSYTGFLWLSHQVGLNGFRAHIAGLIFTTSAFYLTNIYGRSGFSEFIATSAIPLVMASGFHIIKSERLGLVSALLFVFSTVLMTGSHTITFVWGTLYLLFIIGILYFSFNRYLSHRIIILVALALLSIGINTWTLLPTLSYHSLLGINNYGFEQHAEISKYFSDIELIFSPFKRFAPKESTTPNLYTQLPVLALIWALSAIVIYWKNISASWRKLSIGIGLILGTYLILVLVEQSWLLVPKSLKMIQYPYRLQTYIALSISILVMIGLVSMKTILSMKERKYIVLNLCIIAIVGLSLNMGVWQAWTAAHYGPNRKQVLENFKYQTTTYDYFDRKSLPIIKQHGAQRENFKPEMVRNDKLVTKIKSNKPLITNISGSSKFIDIEGADIIGRTKEGYLVIKSTNNENNIKVKKSNTAEIIIGKLVTLASIIMLIILMFILIIKRLRGK